MPIGTLIGSAAMAMGMGWAIGAQDVSNTFGTSVGSGALNVRQACVLAGVFEFGGALVGGSVASMLASGVLDMPAFIAQAEQGANLYARVMLCAMAGALGWLIVATVWSLPVSTSHALVGGMVGLGLATTGSANWWSIALLASSWVTSPLFGGCVSYALASYLESAVHSTPNPAEASKQLLPMLTSFVLGLLGVMVVRLGPSWLALSPMLALAFGGAVAGLVLLIAHPSIASSLRNCYMGGMVDFVCGTLHDGYTPLPSGSEDKEQVDKLDHIANDDNDVLEDQEEEKLPKPPRPHPTPRKNSNPDDPSTSLAEKRFIGLMVVTACVLSFAHGSNDVSNAVAPFAAVLEVETTKGINPTASVPLWTLAAAGALIVVGLATYGHRVMATVGTSITTLTFSKGFAAQFATALVVLTATQLGLSVSTTHVLIGAISGVALVQGIDNVNKATLSKIVVSWIVTLPAAAALALILFGILQSFDPLTI